VRTLLFTAALALCATAQAQSPLVKILSDELDRNFTILKQKGDPPPYFMNYAVSDSEADVVIASAGAIDAQSHLHQRVLDVSIRAGSPDFDNYRRVGSDRPRFTSATTIALDDNPISIRHSLWLSTDRVYRAVSNRLIRLKTDEKLRAQATDTSADFSKEEPQVYFSVAPKYKFDANDWAKRLRKLSADFSKFPGALNSNVSVEAERIAKTLVTTEGTRIEHGRLFARMVVSARGKAADGMDLSTIQTFEARQASQRRRNSRGRRESRRESLEPAARASGRSLCWPRDPFRPRFRRLFSRDFRTPHRRPQAEG
jgi:TldD protein